MKHRQKIQAIVAMVMLLMLSAVVEAQPVSDKDAVKPAKVMAVMAAKPMAAKPAMGPEPKAEPKTEPKEPKAASGKKDSWWKVLMGRLTELALLFLFSILATIGTMLIRWVAKKMKIEDANQIAQLEKLYDSVITMGVNFARQQAHKLKDNPDAKGKRIEWAMDFIQKGVKELGLPKKTADWLKKKIESKIGEQERKPEG